MERDFIMIPGTVVFIIPVPGAGASICAIIHGLAGAWAMVMAVGGFILGSALAATGVADGAAADGGAPASIVLRMHGTVPAATVIMAIIFTVTGTHIPTITLRTFTGTGAALLPGTCREVITSAMSLPVPPAITGPVATMAAAVRRRRALVPEERTMVRAGLSRRGQDRVPDQGPIMFTRTGVEMFTSGIRPRINGSNGSPTNGGLCRTTTRPYRT
jgi:hypothetical protein